MSPGLRLAAVCIFVASVLIGCASAPAGPTFVCGACQTPVPETATRCMGCGAFLEPVEPGVPAAQQPAQDAPEGTGFECGECGGEVAEDATVCPHCGASLEGEEEEEEEDQSEDEGRPTRIYITPKGEFYYETVVTADTRSTQRQTFHGRELQDEETDVKREIWIDRFDASVYYGVGDSWELGLHLPATLRAEESLTMETMTVEREEAWGTDEASISTLYGLPPVTDLSAPLLITVGADLYLPTDSRHKAYTRTHRGSCDLSVDFTFIFDKRYVYGSLGGALDFAPVESGLEAGVGAGWELTDALTLSLDASAAEDEVTVSLGTVVIVKEEVLVGLDVGSVVTDGEQDLEIALTLGY